MQARAGRHHVVVAACALLVLVGLLTIGLALNGRRDAPPQAAPVAAADFAAQAEPTTGPSTATQRAAPPLVLPRSIPTALRVPKVGIESSLTTVGLAADGTMEVPSGADVDRAAWFTGSPTPGEPGPAVIVGHLDNDHAPSVFYRLGGLRPGDAVTVPRADGRDATFTVYRAERVSKDAFPTRQVYDNTPGPELRLISCSGPFDAATGHYADNTIVFARLAS